MKTIDALKLAGIVAAGVGAYLVITRAAKAGGNVVAAVSDVVTRDLNPASADNVIYKNLPSTIQEKVGDFLGFVFDNANYTKYKAASSNGGNSNLQTQHITLAPTGAGAGQSSPGFAATDPRRLDNPNYVNPFANATKIDYSDINAVPGGLF